MAGLPYDATALDGASVPTTEDARSHTRMAPSVFMKKNRPPLSLS